METIGQASRYCCIAGITVYQKCLSPLLGPRCRFYPSCSHYAIEVLQQHSLWKSFYLIIRRLLRCQPLCAGGYDPVPKSTQGNHHGLS